MCVWCYAIVHNRHSSQIILLNKVETPVFLAVLKSVSYGSFYMAYCLWYIILVFIIKWVLFPAKAHSKSSPHTNLTRNTKCSRCGVHGLLLLTAWFLIVFRFLNMASTLRMSVLLLSQSPWALFTWGVFLSPCKYFAVSFLFLCILCALKSSNFMSDFLCYLYFLLGTGRFVSSWNTLVFLGATFSLKQFLISIWTLIRFCVSYNICPSLFGGTMAWTQSPNISL